MNQIHIKICGLRTESTLDTALTAGADLVGFVHYAKSPRHVDLVEGHRLSMRARGRAMRVLLLVDPDDDRLDAAVAALDPDLIQLHGSETPERVSAIKARTSKPVMKAIGVASRADLARLAAFENVADRILLDAKPISSAELPGGNGRSFDWCLLDGLRLPSSLMLSGGLNPENVFEAVARTGVSAVDVSSGVESRPGEKDPDRIAAFIAALRRG